MTRSRWLRRLAPALLAPVVLTGYIDEISEIFTIILFSESDNPDTRETGKVMALSRHSPVAVKIRARTSKRRTVRAETWHVEAAKRDT